MRRFAVTKMSTGVAALAVLTSVALLSGCASDAPGTQSRDLTIALAVEPVSLDPCDTQDAANAVVLRSNVTESLTRIDPSSGEVVPVLAESWEQKNDSTWTFHLREGVTFQDGTAMDADAVVSSISRVVDPELNCQNLDQFPNSLVITAVDPLTVDITSSAPDSILPLRISYADIAAASTPADEKTSEPIGTGPYAFDSREQGTSVKLVRYDGYWGDAPEAASVTYVYRAEPSVRAGMATTGEASIATAISAQDATDDDRTREYNDNRVFFLRTPTDRAPFDDVRVRQAAQLAIDKATIVGALMERSGVPADQIVVSTVNGYVDGYEAPAFDLEEAKALLAEAEADGVAVDTAFDLVSRPDLFPGADEVIQAIHQNLSDAGFNVNILSLDTDAWLQLLRAPFPADQKPSVIAISHDNVSGDATFTFPKYIGSEGANSTISNPEIDTLLAEAELAVGDERAALFAQAARVEYEEVGAYIPIALQSKLIKLAAGIEYQPNGLTGVELRVSDITFTN